MDPTLKRSSFLQDWRRPSEPLGNCRDVEADFLQDSPDASQVSGTRCPERVFGSNITSYCLIRGGGGDIRKRHSEGSLSVIEKSSNFFDMNIMNNEIQKEAKLRASHPQSSSLPPPPPSF